MADNTGSLIVHEDWNFNDTELWERIHINLPHCDIEIVRVLNPTALSQRAKIGLGSIYRQKLEMFANVNANQSVQNQQWIAIGR